MKTIILPILALLLSVISSSISDGPKKYKTMEPALLTEKAVLDTLDHSIHGHYKDFINLGHGYFELANCRLTLFKDGNEWALIFEKFGFVYRSGDPVLIEFSFWGNCVNEHFYLDMPCNFEAIAVENDIYNVLRNNHDTITIRGTKVKIPTDMSDYLKYGIEWENDGKTIENYPGAILKYLAEEHCELTRAKDEELMKFLPKNLKKIMTIDDWHQEEYHHYIPTHPPSTQEAFQMIAKVLVTGDTTLYKPTKTSNTHWKNYPESGGL